MNVYLIEVIIFLISVLLVTIILDMKKIHKLSIALPILFLIFIAVITGTYILERPTLEISNQPISLEIGQATSIQIPYTTYHMKDVTSSVTVTGDVDYNKIGSYHIQYEVPTITGIYAIEQIVNIVDKTPPTITLKGDKDFNLS